jgi:hypothetical protein
MTERRHKLNLELSDAANRQLTTLANDANISRPELIRRALAVYDTLLELRKEEGGHLIIQIKGELKELILES